MTFFKILSSPLLSLLALLAIIVPARADNTITMLPPTTDGQHLCSSGENNVLIYSGIATGAINCIPASYNGATSNFAISSNLSVTGTSVLNSTIFTNDVWLGSTENAAFANSEYGPAFHISGYNTWNTDDFYFQRVNEANNTSSLRLMLGDDANAPYTTGSTASSGDAFVIGATSFPDTTFIPRFTFTSNGNLGIGTTSPQAKLDVAGEIRISNDGATCSAANAGAMRWNGATFEGCNGTSWQTFGKSRLANTENISCSQGNGGTGGCGMIHSSGGTSEYKKTTQQSHDLCMLAGAAGWAGGLWGQCIVSGAPGGQWTLDVAVYQNQVYCAMNCYDFQ